MEFEKWRAIRAGVGGVGGALALVACLRGWCASMLAWAVWVSSLRG